jgi:hypothetical protein
MNTALEYSTRVVQEGGRRCKKSTLNDLVHLTPLRIPLMNPPSILAEKSSWDRQTDGQNLVWFGEIERKLAKLSKTTFAYRSSSSLFYAGYCLLEYRNTKKFLLGDCWRIHI